MKYIVKSRHTELRDDGVPLEPDEVFELSADETKSSYYARMIEEGVLVPHKAGDKQKATAEGEGQTDSKEGDDASTSGV